MLLPTSMPPEKLPYAEISQPVMAEVRQFRPIRTEDPEPQCYIDFSKNPSIKLDCLDIGGYASRANNITASEFGTSGTTTYSGSISGSSIYPGTLPGGTNPFGNTNSFMNAGYNGTNGEVTLTGLSWINQLGLTITPKDGVLTGPQYDFNNIADNKYNQAEVRFFERKDSFSLDKTKS